MNFLMDLAKWFIAGNPIQNDSSSQSVFVEQITIPEPMKNVDKLVSPDFDFLKDVRTQDFITDLQSIRPLAEQFDRARADLLNELQRLAPRKKRLMDIFKNAA